MGLRTYSELITLSTFKERFNYLRLDGRVGLETFGHDRYLNQILYNSTEWRNLRSRIVTRDCGRDLACEGYDIYGQVLVHHINPITVKDILDRNPMVFDPENLITTVHNTHNAIHYGDESLLTTEPIIRYKDDTCPWNRQGGL